MTSPIIHAPSHLPLGLVGSDRHGRDGIGDSAFGGYLRKEQSSPASTLRFSSHAQQRIESRQLELSSVDMGRLNQGVASLKAKNVRDGLVVVGDHRFVVSVENKTVITVLSSNDREVFTNIQGVAFE